jgi:hypothetical protein
MTVPLGNTPERGNNNPEELNTDGLNYMGKATQRGEAPVILFYRTLEFSPPFAPKAENIDNNTGQPRLVHPVVVDLYFPNGPLAGRVYRRVGFINAGLTGPIRKTAIGSIQVGQLGVDKSRQGTVYPQLNALDPDALAWATKIHQAANGNVFAYYDAAGEQQQPAPAGQSAPAQQPADRFGGQGIPQPGGQQQPAPAGMPGMGGPPPGFPGAGGNGQQQPQPVTAPPPAGVPALGGPPPGFPGANSTAGAQQSNKPLF